MEQKEKMEHNLKYYGLDKDAKPHFEHLKKFMKHRLDAGIVSDLPRVSLPYNTTKLYYELNEKTGKFEFVRGEIEYTDIDNEYTKEFGNTDLT